MATLKSAFGLQRDKTVPRFTNLVYQFLKLYNMKRNTENVVRFVHPDDENVYICQLDIGRQVSGLLYAKLIVKHSEHKEDSPAPRFSENHVFDLLHWMTIECSVINLLFKNKQFTKYKGELHGVYGII